MAKNVNFSVIIVIFATLGTTTVTDAVLVALITIVMFVIPLIINRFKKQVGQRK